MEEGTSDMDMKVMNLGNVAISFEMAQNILLLHENTDKVFSDVPYFHPAAGQAYLFQSNLPLCKLHARFDPFKFVYLGKGYNKEFGVLKRYYHLKHNKFDLDKNIYNFQRHIYCIDMNEKDRSCPTTYLVHYFGNEILLQDAPFRKGVVQPDVTRVSVAKTEAQDFHFEGPTIPSQSEEPFIPPPSGGHTSDMESGDASNHVFEFAAEQTVNPSRKRKLLRAPSPMYRNNRRSQADNVESPPQNTFEFANTEAMRGLRGPEYLFAINMASQLQQLPPELKAKVKFQIATVFYEAEMKAINGNLDDD